MITMRKLGDKLRMAAILVATLDEDTADALLEQMPAEIVAKVRRAMVELEEPDGDEQLTVIREFFQDPDYTECLPASEGVELSPELQRKLGVSPPEPAHRMPPAPLERARNRPPEQFQFLEQASVDELVQLLSEQHPQVAAIVLARISPDKSAGVLRHFATEVQVEILQRIADSQLPDRDILLELEQQLQRRMIHRSLEPVFASPGMDAVQAILSAARHEDCSALMERLRQVDQRLLRHAPGSVSSLVREPAAGDPLAAGSAGSYMRDEDTAAVLSMPKPPGGQERRSTGVDGIRTDGTIHWQFSDIMRLGHSELARLFQAADPRDLLVALAGADRSFVARILGGLPADDGRRLRQRLRELGPLHPDDVREAQRRLAKLADSLHARGLLVTPCPAQPAAAA
jgi:flagellar motor switch protein FliG